MELKNSKTRQTKKVWKILISDSDELGALVFGDTRSLDPQDKSGGWESGTAQHSHALWWNVTWRPIGRPLVN